MGWEVNGGRGWEPGAPRSLVACLVEGSLVVEGVRADARTVFLPLRTAGRKPVRALGCSTAETGP